MLLLAPKGILSPLEGEREGGDMRVKSIPGPIDCLLLMETAVGPMALRFQFSALHQHFSFSPLSVKSPCCPEGVNKTRRAPLRDRLVVRAGAKFKGSDSSRDGIRFSLQRSGRLGFDLESARLLRDLAVLFH